MKYTLTECMDVFCRGGWQISEADRQYLEAEYDDYNATNASGAAFCRSAVLIVCLLKHTFLELHLLNPLTDFINFF